MMIEITMQNGKTIRIELDATAAPEKPARKAKAPIIALQNRKTEE